MSAMADPRDRGTLGQTKKLGTPSGRLTSLRTRDLTLSGALKKTKVGFFFIIIIYFTGKKQQQQIQL